MPNGFPTLGDALACLAPTHRKRLLRVIGDLRGLLLLRSQFVLENQAFGKKCFRNPEFIVTFCHRFTELVWEALDYTWFRGGPHRRGSP